jgi:hypothetical protein
MKKKDQLLEIVKKNETYNLLSYLVPQDILNLSLVGKRYYSSLLGTLSSLRIDSEITTKQNKSRPAKSKNLKNKQ